MSFDCFVEGLTDEGGGSGPSTCFVGDVIFHCCAGIDLEFSLSVLDGAQTKGRCDGMEGVDEMKDRRVRRRMEMRCRG